MIQFTIPGVPIAQPRHKVSGKHRWLPKTKAGDEHPVVAYKEEIRLRAQQEDAKPIKGPVYLYVIFVMPRPSKGKTPTRLWHASKPDLDNLVKAVQDALKGVAWKDDTQVCCASISKVYAASDEEPHTEISIFEAGYETKSPLIL